MKRFTLLFLAILLLIATGCNKETKENKKDDDNKKVEVGINFRDKTLGQIMPGFPEDLIELKNMVEINAVYHQYFYPDNDFKNMTGATRDTCYAVEYVADDVEAAFTAYLSELNGKVNARDPDRFEIEKDGYLIRFRKHTGIEMMYINCYTNLGKEYKEARLDDVAERYSPKDVGQTMLEKKLLILPESTSCIFSYSYKGEDEPILEFYRTLVSNESMRNDTTYFEDDIVGTELGQFITVSHKYNTVDVDEVTYQE